MPITFLNSTGFDATCVVLDKARTDAVNVLVAPQHFAQLSTAHRYTVVAEHVVHGVVRRSVPVTVTGGAKFFASAIHDPSQKADVLTIEHVPDAGSKVLRFHVDGLAPVDFMIERDGAAFRTITTSDARSEYAVQIDESYTIFAVVNGITTDEVSTTNANALVTVASIDGASLSWGYRLQVD